MIFQPQRLLRDGPNTTTTTIFAPEIPQGEIAATNFYVSGGSLGEKLGEELGEILDEIFWAFSCASFAVQNDPTKFLPKFLPICHPMSCHDSCG